MQRIKFAEADYMALFLPLVQGDFSFIHLNGEHVTYRVSDLRLIASSQY